MDEFGTLPPQLVTATSAAASSDWIDRLARTECPAHTARRARREDLTGLSHDPIVWAEARGFNVRDVVGNVYVDLTSGFGAALIGHAHPRVLSAVCNQSKRALHALGDFHPSDRKIELLERLSSLAPWPNARVALALGGADAVTTALKTACLHTQRPGIVCFSGSYHGLSYGPLAVTSFSRAFRDPFVAQLNPHVIELEWPTTDNAAHVLESLETLPWNTLGAVIFEVVQGRGGVRLAPPGFFQRVVEIAHHHGAVAIADEILTGLGRCGATWLSATERIDADLICAGKALGGGLPISACLGKLEVMQSWGAPDQVPIHTGTFFGSPLACAASLAALAVFEDERIAARATEIGAEFRTRIERASIPTLTTIRQVGCAIGVEFDASIDPLAVVQRLLEHGFITLPAGTNAEVVELLPSVDCTTEAIDAFVAALFDSTLLAGVVPRG